MKSFFYHSKSTKTELDTHDLDEHLLNMVFVYVVYGLR